ncbi:NUDIX domain-containing protein [Reinekea marinisedimentorum]|uniref:ADP-ribose pyrophosphatase n=1 Tax=Reinekea marinisedimentorum TaxID=230495 RepID=A0A4R3I5C5_9GAMM|nr:NUDIX domain-containing protein [Reinekea marinisedimentorum]TCS41162.1 ADP-ribose pyrophosphatase [Reinekea marinisedimentorum]
MKRDTDSFQFQIDQDKPLYSGFYSMKHLTVSHQRYDGSHLTIERELMDRHDAVCLLLVDVKADKFVFIEQFRVGALRESNPWLIEMVAGLIDKDEKPDEVARREAVEEAGVDVGRLEFICKYLPSPGGTNERVFLYVGEVDSSTASGVHGLDEEGEDIRVHTPSITEAYQWLEDGQIINAASIIALQWFQLHESRLRAQWA